MSGGPASSLFVPPEAPVREACRVIESNAVKMALVVDRDGKLLGTVTDGDVRRGLLKGVNIEESVRRVMHERPLTALQGTPRQELVSLMRLHRVLHIPLLDAAGAVAGVESMDAPGVRAPARPETVVIFAGGEGRRLMPLTEKMPKPMLPVGGRPILEAILERLAGQGFRRFTLAVHYLEDVIRERIGDGSRLGVEVSYIREPEPLGTAGALRLARERLSDDFLVMNADLLTTVHMPDLLDFHRSGGHAATLAAREYSSRIPFGVLRLEDGMVAELVEKPAVTRFIFAGVAALRLSSLDFLPASGPCDMPDLVRAMISAGKPVAAFPLHEEWLDIGRPEDYRKASGAAAPGGRDE